MCLDWDVLFLDVSGFFVALLLSFVVSSSSKTSLCEWTQYDTTISMIWLCWRSRSIRRAGGMHPMAGSWDMPALKDLSCFATSPSTLLGSHPAERYGDINKLLVKSSWETVSIVGILFCWHSFVSGNAPSHTSILLVLITKEAALQWSVDHGRPPEIAGNTAGAPKHAV